MKLSINGAVHQVDVDEDMPLLWVLRDELHLIGTKYGCGAGLCGACSVLIDGVAARSCLVRAVDAGGDIVTVEGVGVDRYLAVVQEVWIENQVAQCGYCQPGQIIAAVSLLKNNLAPSDEDIDRAFAGHLCRCGTYKRIRHAIKSAAANLAAPVASSDPTS